MNSSFIYCFNLFEKPIPTNYYVVTFTGAAVLRMLVALKIYTLPILVCIQITLLSCILQVECGYRN